MSGVSIEVTARLEPIEEALGDLYKKAPLVMSRAANRTASSAATYLKKQTTKVYDIKSGEVANAIKKKGRATAGSPYVKITYSGVKKNLADVPSARSRKLVRPFVEVHGGRPRFYSTHVLKGRGPVALTHSPKPFVRTAASSGHTALFFKSPRDPGGIQGIAGPSVPQEVGSEKRVLPFVKNQILTKLSDRVDHEIDWILSKG